MAPFRVLCAIRTQLQSQCWFPCMLLFVQLFASRALNCWKHEMGALSMPKHSKERRLPFGRLVRCSAHGCYFARLWYTEHWRMKIPDMHVNSNILCSFLVFRHFGVRLYQSARPLPQEEIYIKTQKSFLSEDISMFEWNSQKVTKLDENDNTTLSHYSYILVLFRQQCHVFVNCVCSRVVEGSEGKGAKHKVWGFAECRTQDGKMLSMLAVDWRASAVDWRASAVRGKEVGHFREIVAVSIVAVGDPRFTLDTFNCRQPSCSLIRFRDESSFADINRLMWGRREEKRRKGCCMVFNPLTPTRMRRNQSRGYGRSW